MVCYLSNTLAFSHQALRPQNDVLRISCQVSSHLNAQQCVPILLDTYLNQSFRFLILNPNLFSVLHKKTKELALILFHYSRRKLYIYVANKGFLFSARMGMTLFTLEILTLLFRLFFPHQPNSETCGLP